MYPKSLKPGLAVRQVILVAVTASFFTLTAWLARPVGTHWNSPDEMANAFWAARVAAGESLAVHDPLVAVGAGAVHPRSFAVLGDALVPGSFPGLFLFYGAINGLTQLPLWVLTPFFTALAGLALYGALRRRDERWAFWSALFFLANPAVIYYASRGLFPNLLVVDLLIFALWFLASRPFSEWHGENCVYDDLAAGLLVGGALVTRLAELPWIACGVAAWFWASSSPRRFRRAAWLVVGLAVPLALYAWLNFSVYGSPFRTGYVLAPASLTAAASATSLASGVVPTASALPFGFHPHLALVNAWNYALMFWYVTWSALAGFVLVLFRWKRRTRGERAETVFALVLTGWVVAFYGSWLVRDRYDVADVTIGTSYVRYFLPVLVLAAPFATRAVLAFGDRIGRPRLIASLAFVIVTMLSLYATVWQGDESLLAVRRTLVTDEAKAKVLMPLVPSDAILLTARFDKVLFPERWRFVPNFDTGSLARLGDLVTAGRVFYYGLDSDGPERQALTAAAGAQGLAFEKTASPWPGESLWSLNSETTTQP